MSLNVSARLNADLFDAKYAAWKADPSSVEATWAAFFSGFELGLARPAPGVRPTLAAPPATEEELSFRGRAGALVYSFRSIGHTAAWIDPLTEAPPDQPRLAPSAFGFSDADLNRRIASNFYKGGAYMPLQIMIEELRTAYCGRIGFEFMHIHNTEVRNWLRDRIETRPVQPGLDPAARKRLLHWLLEAETFEHFLHRKYPGEKRFSLEGAESLMVALNTVLEGCPALQVEEIVMGMAHRGRLTVLAGFLRKSLRVLLYEFSENYVPTIVGGDGDVKYHLGYEAERELDGGKRITIRLAANPSHLEAVNPVVEGKARARQRVLGDSDHRRRILPLLIHGDAAFAGQGLVAEVLNLSQLPGYRTGGTIHIVVNNQIGFTTSPADARSSNYCTDVAKMIEAPVFHVNGDSPADVAFAAALALDFRQHFNRDVVIDMVCYRRHGHNEGDEPEFTQPQIYRLIKEKPSTATLFQRALESESVLQPAESTELRSQLEARMEAELTELQRLQKEGRGHPFMESSAVVQPAYSHDPVPTGIQLESLRRLGLRLTEIPKGFEVNDKIRRRFLDRRRECVEQGGPYNWAFAEALAFGSLLAEGAAVRLSGQDSRRGTFSQRHAVLYDARTRDRYIPLQNIAPGQATFRVYNSLLSEAAVLGFDYGYSLMCPDILILWEAQFGDFANGAQVIIDQFIVSAESKWQQPSGIVMLLPHGYEGMGPEHSSARMERFLQLSAQQNIQVANLTTPAQYFHILRRQLRRPFLKPLVLMTPKSLLNHPECISGEEDFADGACFREILDDHLGPQDPERVNRLVFCSGKVYYDLRRYRETNDIRDTALIRLEQVYPVHHDLLTQIVERYPKARKWVWCQEEPLNMGAWSFIGPRLQQFTRYKVRYAGRDRSASPAAGAKVIHKHEQKKLVEDAFIV